jgi:membrane-associated phospholipid phosphatase
MLGFGGVRRVLMPVLAVGTMLVIGASRARAGDGGGDDSAYKLSYDLDLPILLVSAGLSSSYLFMSETAPPRCAPLCDQSSVNALDRRFAGLYSPTWETVGNVAMASTLVLVPASLLIHEPSWRGLGDVLVVGEAVVLTAAIQVPVSYAVNRPRPFLYSEKAPLSAREAPSSGGSFFSGHVANCLAATLVATTALRRTGHRDLAWTVLVVGLAGSAVVGVARVASGNHFPTDVAVGYAVGASVGIAVPALHASRYGLSPLAEDRGGGLAVVGAF